MQCSWRQGLAWWQGQRLVSRCNAAGQLTLHWLEAAVASFCLNAADTEASACAEGVLEESNEGVEMSNTQFLPHVHLHVTIRPDCNTGC